eukprot:1649290-Rhodomonas_salina.1
METSRFPQNADYPGYWSPLVKSKELIRAKRECVFAKQIRLEGLEGGEPHTRVPGHGTQLFNRTFS